MLCNKNTWVSTQIPTLILPSSSPLCLGFCIFTSWLYLEQENPSLVLSLHGAAIQINNNDNQPADQEKHSFVYADQPSIYDCKELARKKNLNFKLTEQQETFCCKAECLNYDVSPVPISSHTPPGAPWSHVKLCNIGLTAQPAFLGVVKNIRVNASRQASTVSFVGSEKFAGRWAANKEWNSFSQSCSVE